MQFVLFLVSFRLQILLSSACKQPGQRKQAQYQHNNVAASRGHTGTLVAVTESPPIYSPNKPCYVLHQSSQRQDYNILTYPRYRTDSPTRTQSHPCPFPHTHRKHHNGAAEWTQTPVSRRLAAATRYFPNSFWILFPTPPMPVKFNNLPEAAIPMRTSCAGSGAVLLRDWLGCKPYHECG